ncbi:MAG: amino acid permease, partial [Mesorhizobium sp.]
ADAIAAVAAAATPAIRTWSLWGHTLGPVSFTFNATFFIGAVLMLMIFSIQHRGILGTASVQKYIGLLVI